MARGEYGTSYVGTNGTNGVPKALPAEPPPSPQAPTSYDPRGATARPSAWDSRPERRPWTESQRQALQRSIGLSAIGSVAGAVLWKDHRVWGFILGGMAGGGLGNVIFAPRDPWCDYLNR